jgi:hypothetical protein
MIFYVLFSNDLDFIKCCFQCRFLYLIMIQCFPFMLIDIFFIINFKIFRKYQTLILKFIK